MNEDIEYAHSAIDPFWRFHKTLTVLEATAILCGFEPSEVMRHLNDTYFAENHPRFEVMQSLLEKSLRAGDIQGSHMPLTDTDWNGNLSGEIAGSTNPKTSEVDRDSLVLWLRSLGFRTGFFFPDSNTTDTPGYLDPNHPRYAPKLAAAVRAWEAMEDANLLGKLKPKPAMEKWLEINYKALGLVQKQSNERDNYKIGDMSKSAVKAVAEFANWETDGASTKTPGA